tara:strand:- start:121 stop:363 length:243 start_codon:yes stop_codon:yes gene_type:complete
MSIKNTGILPRIYTCSDNVNMVDYIDINYAALGLTNLPTVSPSASVDVNIFMSNITTSTARINFSQKFIGTVYYTVIGFN